FGSDPTLALRNLPAEVIEKIQVFDKLSDQSEFTGIDDGQTTKTMNVILRSDHPVTFGKTYGGGDGDGRYAAGGNENATLGDTRTAVVGLSNNINQQTVSAKAILGGRSPGNQRADGSGASRFGTDRNRKDDANSFLVGPQDGVTTTNSIGTHLE